MDLEKKEGVDYSKSNLEKLERKSKLKRIVKITIIIIFILFLALLIALGLIVSKSLFNKNSGIILKINSAYINSENDSAVINLAREGKGEMTKIEFTFFDFYGNSYLYYYDVKDGLPLENEVKTYRIDSAWVPDLNNFVDLDYVNIVYHYINENGEEVSSSIQDSFGNKPFDDLRNPENNITENSAPIQNRTISRGSNGGGGGGSSGGGNNNVESSGCTPESISVTCNNKCGTQTNNCAPQVVNCGICLQQEWCNGSDINHNGNVDQADYNIWRNNQNCITNQTNNWCYNTDVNHDGIVNSVDYNLWRSRFGDSSCIGVDNPIKCFTDSNCGTNFNAILYCNLNDVYTNSTIFICNNPGTNSSFCTNTMSPVLNRACGSSNICSLGECLPISCNSNSNCGTNFNSSLYCISDSIYINSTAYICNNPGLPSSFCNNSISQNFIQNCPNDINSSNYCKSNNLSVIYYNLTDNFCITGTCDLNIIPGRIKTICPFGQMCSNGACANVECSSNSECGVDSSTGFVCSDNNVNVNRTYLNYTCNNPGLPSSFCTNTPSSYLDHICPSDVNSSDYCRDINLGVVYYNLTDNGCSLGSCTSNMLNHQIKTICSPGQMCSDGACATVKCSSNSECGSTINSSSYCSNGDVYNNVTNPICNNAGTPSSDCVNSTVSVLNKTCPSDVNSSNYCSSSNLNAVYYNSTDNFCDSDNGACSSSLSTQIKFICPIGQICFSGACVPSDQIQISTCTDLQNIRYNVSGSFITGNYALINNIDCSISSIWDSGKGFKPVGNLTKPFNGSFNGNNYTISNLYINRPVEDYIGLFGRTSGVNISNTKVINVNMSGNIGVGGLIGYLDNSTVTNSYSNGSVNGFSVVGGLVGYNFKSKISNSDSTGNVNGSTYVGGLVGYNLQSNISNSYVTGNVNGSSYIGGLVGSNSEGGLIINTYSTGNVNGTTAIGGLVGTNAYGNISNSYTTGNVKGNTNVGGLVGYNGESSLSIINNSYATGNVNGSTYVGGLVGGTGLSLISNSYWNNNSIKPGWCWSNTTGNYSINCTAIQNNAAYFYNVNNAPMNSWNFVNTWSNTNNNVNYPILKWQEAGFPTLGLGNLWERFVEYLKKQLGYS